MTIIDPPGRLPPSHCYGWPPGSCSKFRQSDGYDIWERKKGLQYVVALDAWLCRPCYRAYKKRQQEKIILKPEEASKTK